MKYPFICSARSGNINVLYRNEKYKNPTDQVNELIINTFLKLKTHIIKTITKSNLLIAIILISIFYTCNLFGQEAKSIIFNDARQAYLLAIEKRAEILSPSNFDQGLKYYEREIV